MSKGKKCIVMAFFALLGFFWTFSRLYISVELDNLKTQWGPKIAWQQVLSQGIPGLAQRMPEQDVVVTLEWSWRKSGEHFLHFFTGVTVTDLRTLFYDQIPYAQALSISPSSVKAMTFPHFPKFDFKNFKLKDDPLVGIYYTHTAESFIPMSGATHKPGGQRGDILAVGETLIKTLEKRGFAAVQSQQIHDYPSFMKAYGASEVTAKKMLADYPSLQMIFDIHRDADKRENVTAVIKGVSVAKILIVVGIGQADLVQPHWQQNHAFAKLIEAKLNEKYPGLCRGIQLVDWRYNQHLHPRALLIEVGCQENTEGEVKTAAEMFGDVIADILAENKE